MASPRSMGKNPPLVAEKLPPAAPPPLKRCRQCNVDMPANRKEDWCGVCMRIVAEDVTDCPSGVLDQLSRMASLLEDLVNLDPSTPDGQARLSVLKSDANAILLSTYPIPLSLHAVKLRGYGDVVTEALKEWVRRNCDKSMPHNMIQRLVAKLSPVHLEVSYNLYNMSHPDGEVHILTSILEKRLGVSTDLFSDDRIVVIRLANLYAMLDSNYAGKLAFDIREQKTDGTD